MFTPIGYFAPSGPPPGPDPDAQAFLTATSITDPTITTAINDLVVTLKGLGLYTRFQALYPFVGGTAFTHKFNLINPLDTDAAFRINFFNSVTHNANGIQGSGLNNGAGTGITNYNPAIHMTLNDAHISYYSRTNNQKDGVDMGCLEGAHLFTSARRVNTSNQSVGIFIPAGGSFTATTNTNSQKLYVVNLNPAVVGQQQYFRDGVNILTNTQPHGRPNRTIAIMASHRALSVGVQGQNRNYAFASIGFGFTDAEVVSFTTAVQTFQTTLGREV
jgi:hypothetical protein